MLTYLTNIGGQASASSDISEIRLITKSFLKEEII
jgi:hypothetical protein